jgi:DNA-binding NarL/FixJ family response regulator
MRVVIVDADPGAGRELADAVEQLLPTVDALLYADADQAVDGIAQHAPDVVFVAAQLPGTDGPGLVARAREATPDPKYVGVVDGPDAEWSQRFIGAGAKLVVSRPLDRIAVQTALRYRAGGVP